jgi:hypothetical protein
MNGKTQLRGWISFSEIKPGEFFLSDSYPTQTECMRAYGDADVDGYIDLSLIPPEAIRRVKP